MSVVYAGGGGGGFSNLLKMALSTFGGPVGQAASAIWSAAQGDPLGAVTGAAGLAKGGGLDKLFGGASKGMQIPKSPYSLFGWSPDWDTWQNGVR